MLKIVDFKLPKETFGAEINLKLLSQANYVYSDRNHTGLRSTKTRSEINRSTKKVYKQKGTGGARHGSRRANLFVGGGVIFGPRPIKRILTLSQSIRNAARIVAFSAKSKEKEIAVVSGFAGVAKTKEVAEFLKKQTATRFTLLISEKSRSIVRFAKNLSNAKVITYKDASAFDIWNGGMLLIDETVFEAKKEDVKSKKEGVKSKTK